MWRWSAWALCEGERATAVRFVRTWQARAHSLFNKFAASAVDGAPVVACVSSRSSSIASAGTGAPTEPRRRRRACPDRPTLSVCAADRDVAESSRLIAQITRRRRHRLAHLVISGTDPPPSRCSVEPKAYKARFPLPELTARVNGPSWRVTGFHYPSTRAVLTGARFH